MRKIFISSFLFIATIVHAQKFDQSTKLLAADRTADNNLGTAVAISGNYAVVAASEIPSKGVPSNCNSVYVFEKNSTGAWKQVQKITDPGANAGDQFGFSVAINGNYIIVGAPGDENTAGAAYVFKRDANSNWMQEKKLVATQRTPADFFGSSVSITSVYGRGDDSYVLIGAPGDANFAAGWPVLPRAGSAYFFSNLLGHWEVINKVYPVRGTLFDRNAGAAFGSSVSISGTTAVIGAPGEKNDTTGSNPLEAAGAAYVFERNGSGALELVHKIVYWHRAAGDEFGYSVSISGNQMVIGAPFSKEDATQENPVISGGAAHVFFKQVDGNWWWSNVLVPNDRAVGDNFGTSVSISGNMIVVGAPTADEMSGDIKLKDAGAAYTFRYFDTEENSGWRFFQKIVANDRAETDWFGYSVGIDGDNIIVSAPFQDKNETRLIVADAGAGYLFAKSPCNVSTSSISETACKTYTSPSKKYNWTRSGTYQDTLLTKLGCDSIITVNLTITGKADTSVTVRGKTLTANAKDASYNWIDCETNQPINVTTRTLIATVSGSYKVNIDQGGGCLGTSSCHKIVMIAKPDSTVTVVPSVITRNPSVQKAFLETNKIVAQDRTHNDAFGTSVSISGNYAVIGAPTDDEDERGKSLLGAGSAYIFKLDDDGKWKQLQKISAFDRMPGTAFGCSVAISGNYLVVGANRDNLGVGGKYDSYLAGSAYVYQLNNGTWYFQQKIIANPTTRDGQNFFGTAVAIDGGTIVVSAPSDEKDTTDTPESNVSSSGSLFVYTLTTEGWVQTQKLVAKDRVIGNWLGNSVAICGDNIIAGSWGNDLDAMYANRMESAGAAYIFERRAGRFVLAQKIVAEDRSPYDEFGFSVGISGNYAVVGARRVTEKGDEGMDDYTGNAYIFKRDNTGNWSQQMKINPDDRTKGDYLGTAVGISGDYLIASAWGQDSDSLGNFMTDAGAIYVYYLDKKGNWIQSDKVSPFYKHVGGHFGVAAAISDSTIIGSSVVDQTDENDKNEISGTGAAYIFTAAGCNNHGKCNESIIRTPKKIPIKDPINPTNSGMPKKAQSSNLNGKGNEVKMDTINIKNEPIPEAANIHLEKNRNRSTRLNIDLIKTDCLQSLAFDKLNLRRDPFTLNNE